MGYSRRRSGGPARPPTGIERLCRYAARPPLAQERLEELPDGRLRLGLKKASESCFHTIKYQPDYPGRFRDVSDARAWCEDFFGWYNHDHHHDGLALFTPAQVFFGKVERVAQRRQEALDDAYRRHPQRFVSGAPVAARPPERVLFNPLDAAPTVEALLATPDEQLATLWPIATNNAMPIINLPGTPTTPSQHANAT